MFLSSQLPVCSLPLSLLLPSGVKSVVKAIADKVQRKHGQSNRQDREHHLIWIVHDRAQRLVGKGAPACLGDGNATAHKAQERKTVYWEVWNEPFVTCGKNSFINDIIYAAGGKNIFDDLDADYPMVSQESIIAKNPQVIIIPDANGVSVQNVIQRNGWENLAAVKLMNVSLIDSNISSRPSPRIIEAVKLVEKILWQ